MESMVEHSYSLENKSLENKMSLLDKIIFFKREEQFTKLEKKLNKNKENWGGNNSPQRYQSRQTNDGEDVTDLGILDMQPVSNFNRGKKIDLAGIEEEDGEGVSFDIMDGSNEGGNDIYVK